MNNFSLNVQILRKSNGLKQSDFEDINIKRTTWNNYEAGKSEPDIDTILRIANFFEVDLETLLIKDLSKNQHLLSKIDTLKKPAANSTDVAMEDKTDYNSNVASAEKIKDLQLVIDTQKQLIESLNKNLELLQGHSGK